MRRPPPSSIRRALSIVVLVACAAGARADAVDDRLAAMSIKELRHLARNLGAADEMPRGVVEKGEVVAALAPILRYEEARRREKDRREIGKMEGGRWKRVLCKGCRT